MYNSLYNNFELRSVMAVCYATARHSKLQKTQQLDCSNSTKNLCLEYEEMKSNVRTSCHSGKRLKNQLLFT